MLERRIFGVSHNIKFFDYPEDINKTQVQHSLDDYVAHEDWQEGCSGLCGNIIWLDSIANSYNDAIVILNDYCNKQFSNYNQVAVRYKDVPNVPIVLTKKLKDLRTRLKSLEKKEQELSQAIHYKDCKSSTIACKSCGSRISSKYFGKTVNNYCPICKADLRPSYITDRIKKYKDNIAKVSGKIAEEEARIIKNNNDKIEKELSNAGTRWLVRIEFHT